MIKGDTCTNTPQIKSNENIQVPLAKSSTVLKREECMGICVHHFLEEPTFQKSFSLSSKCYEIRRTRTNTWDN